MLQVRLQPTVTLSMVEVRADTRDPIQKSTQMSEVDMPVRDIQRLPAILGEVDVIKALQLMPGVQGGNEGFAGLYVRGGSPDQNLVLLDGVPIYNPTHVLGIFFCFLILMRLKMLAFSKVDSQHDMAADCPLC